MAMTDQQIERYSRHIILKEVGAKGQKKLLNAKNGKEAKRLGGKNGQYYFGPSG